MDHRLPVTAFSHVGFNVLSLEEMVPFYQHWFGMVVSDRGIGSTGDEVVFLSADEEEHHQLVFATGRGERLLNLNQLSFSVRTLADLISIAKRLSAAGVQILQQKDHGNAWSIYVADPEGNRIEIYTHSPWYVSQPIKWDIDLTTETEDIIFERTKAAAEKTPGYVSREVWLNDMRRRIDEQQLKRSAEVQ